RPPTSTLFPYTTLFRSPHPVALAAQFHAALDDVVELRLDGLEIVDVFGERVVDLVPLARLVRVLLCGGGRRRSGVGDPERLVHRSEEHTSELQSLAYLV